MMEWKTVKLGDVCSVRRGASPRPIQEFLSDKGMPWVKISDATSANSKYLDSTKEYIIEEGISHSVTVLPGTLIVSNSATPGLPVIVRIKACVHDGWLVIDDFNGILKDFLYYKFIDIRRQLSYQANGSVFMNLKTDIVKEFPLHLPPRAEQKRIADILSSLDAKIENNNRVDANLEAQAQALYKSWFVDFEPWGGKMPEDWKEGKVADLIELLNGFAFKSSDFVEDGKYSLITIKGVQDGKMTTEGADLLNTIPAKMPPWCALEKGDILLSLTGNVGRCCLVDTDNCLLNQRVAKLQPKAEYNRLFTYILFRQEEMKYRLIGISRGTAQMNLSPIETGKLSIIIPSEKVLQEFGVRYNNIIDNILTNIEESQRLAKLRDTLLPKLMKGEIEL